jgi:hypothetical protein
MEKMITAYSGEILNFVCDKFDKNKCQSEADFSLNNSLNGKNSSQEAIPHSLFSLLVKIYLS